MRGTFPRSPKYHYYSHAATFNGSKPDLELGTVFFVPRKKVIAERKSTVLTICLSAGGATVENGMAPFAHDRLRLIHVDK